MAIKKKAAKKKSPARPLLTFPIVVKVDNGRVLLEAEDGGNLFASPGDTVSFTCAGNTVPPFTLSVIEFKKGTTGNRVGALGA